MLFRIVLCGNWNENIKYFLIFVQIDYSLDTQLVHWRDRSWGDPRQSSLRKLNRKTCCQSILSLFTSVLGALFLPVTPNFTTILSEWVQNNRHTWSDHYFTSLCKGLGVDLTRLATNSTALANKEHAATVHSESGIVHVWNMLNPSVSFKTVWDILYCHIKTHSWSGGVSVTTRAREIERAAVPPLTAKQTQYFTQHESRILHPEEPAG